MTDLVRSMIANDGKHPMCIHPRPTFHQSSIPLGIRTAGLALVLTTAFSGSTVVADQPSASAALLEQSVPRIQVNPDNQKYAQFWWPLERNYYYGPPRRNPRLDVDPGPPPDDRFARDTKRKVIEQLRAAS